MSKQQIEALYLLCREDLFDPDLVIDYYHKKQYREADKKAAIERKKKIERIALREGMSLELAEEFYEVGHMV
jgi:hypothetical protein